MIYGHPKLAEKLRRRARWIARLQVVGLCILVAVILAATGATLDRV